MLDLSASSWSGDSESVDIVFSTEKEENVSSFVIMEQIEHSQRIEEFEIYAKVNEEWLNIYSATTVGYKKICILENSVCSNKFKISIKSSRVNPVIQFIGIYN